MDRLSRKTRCMFRHKGRAHRIGLVPFNPDAFISCGEDGLCCLFDIRDSRRSMFTDLQAADSEMNPVEASSGRSLVNKATFMDHRALKRSIYCVSTNPQKNYEVIMGGSTTHLSLFDMRKFDQPVAYLCPANIASAAAVSHVTGVKFDYAGKSVVASYNDEAVYSMKVRGNYHLIFILYLDDGIRSVGQAFRPKASRDYWYKKKQRSQRPCGARRAEEQ